MLPSVGDTFTGNGSADCAPARYAAQTIITRVTEIEKPVRARKFIMFILTKRATGRNAR